MNAKTLASTIEFNEAHFELLKTLDLLPKNPGEDRGVWFNRLAAYEKENELQIEDMVRVILDMKKKDEKRLAEEELKRKGPPLSPSPPCPCPCPAIIYQPITYQPLTSYKPFHVALLTPMLLYASRCCCYCCCCCYRRCR